jgi:hypothetical protein
MPRVGFEPTTPMFERDKTTAATVIGQYGTTQSKYQVLRYHAEAVNNS